MRFSHSAWSSARQSGSRSTHTFVLSSLKVRRADTLKSSRRSQLALRPRYDCPSPLTPRSARATPLRRPSAPLVLPAALPEFSVSITYDTAVCNSFDVVISRLDKWRCAEVEADAAPTNHSAFLDFARTRLGPDTFHILIDGAERLAEEVPTEYLGSCEYLHRFRLNNAGRVWMNASLLYEVRPESSWLATPGRTDH